METKKLKFSVVLPTYNEEKNLQLLYKELTKVCDELNEEYELIFIDDGSTDGSLKILYLISEIDSNVKIIKFRKNFGQTAALDAGIKKSKGKIIITMDSDLQNDPKDIPRLLKKLNEGYDMVSGWRYNRQDNLSKNIISRGANLLRKIIIKDCIHDSGCTLKIYKRECLNELNLYGEFHRFIPALLDLKGFKIAEIKVNHRKRKFEKSKYTYSRILKGFLDLMLLKFWISYSTKPIHLFGGVGILSGVIGFIMALYLTYIKLIEGGSIANRPLLILSALLILVGIILLVFGVIADILIKIYYKNEKSYFSE